MEKCILVISDQHIPYQHPQMLDFLKGIKRKYKPTRIINIGDELDHHALSFHDSDSDLPSAGDEHRLALKTIKEMEQLFPKMDSCPKKSSKFFGLNLSARGALLFI